MPVFQERSRRAFRWCCVSGSLIVRGGLLWTLPGLSCFHFAVCPGAHSASVCKALAHSFLFLHRFPFHSITHPVSPLGWILGLSPVLPFDPEYTTRTCHFPLAKEKSSLNSWEEGARSIFLHLQFPIYLSTGVLPFTPPLELC